MAVCFAPDHRSLGVLFCVVLVLADDCDCADVPDCFVAARASAAMVISMAASWTWDLGRWSLGFGRRCRMSVRDCDTSGPRSPPPLKTRAPAAVVMIKRVLSSMVSSPLGRTLRNRGPCGRVANAKSCPFRGEPSSPISQVAHPRGIAKCSRLRAHQNEAARRMCSVEPHSS